MGRKHTSDQSESNIGVHPACLVTFSIEEPAGVLGRKFKLLFRILFAATFLSRTFAARALNTSSFFLGWRGVGVFRFAPSSRPRHYIAHVDSLQVFCRIGFAPRLRNLAQVRKMPMIVIRTTCSESEKGGMHQVQYLNWTQCDATAFFLAFELSTDIGNCALLGGCRKENRLAVNYLSR